MITLSKHKRDGKNKIIAVWSPTATGKTMVAVNLAAMMSGKMQTALVDLSSDNAVYTWFNCQGTNGLHDLIFESNPDSYYSPLQAPKLLVYTQIPGNKAIYNGEASVLNQVPKHLGNCYVVIDCPRDILKAANILVLSDIVLFVADFNIHGTLFAQEHLKNLGNYRLVINKYSNSYPKFANPAEILKMEPLAEVPDVPEEIYQDILTGNLSLSNQNIRKAFEIALKGVVTNA